MTQNNRARELAERATKFCLEKEWGLEESTAWIWEEKFVEFIVLDILESLKELEKEYEEYSAPDMNPDDAIRNAINTIKWKFKL